MGYVELRECPVDVARQGVIILILVDLPRNEGRGEGYDAGLREDKDLGRVQSYVKLREC